MKTFMAVLVTIVTFTIIVFSGSGCSGNNPEEPAPTATITPPPTATITPLVIDNFEDGADLDNYFNPSWFASAVGGASTLHNWGEYTGVEKNGSYAFKVSGYAQANATAGSYYYGNLNFSTGATTGANPADITGYNNMKFSMYLGGAVTGSAYLSVQIWMSDGGTNEAWKEIAATFDPVFHEYVIDLSTFSPIGTLSGLYADLKQIIFYIYARSTVQNDDAEIQCYIDDIRFTE